MLLLLTLNILVMLGCFKIIFITFESWKVVFFFLRKKEDIRKHGHKNKLGPHLNKKTTYTR